MCFPYVQVNLLNNEIRKKQAASEDRHERILAEAKQHRPDRNIKCARALILETTPAASALGWSSGPQWLIRLAQTTPTLSTHSRDPMRENDVDKPLTETRPTIHTCHIEANELAITSMCLKHIYSAAGQEMLPPNLSLNEETRWR